MFSLLILWDSTFCFAGCDQDTKLLLSSDSVTVAAAKWLFSIVLKRIIENNNQFICRNQNRLLWQSVFHMIAPDKQHLENIKCLSEVYRYKHSEEPGKVYVKA